MDHIVLIVVVAVVVVAPHDIDIVALSVDNYRLPNHKYSLWNPFVMNASNSRHRQPIHSSHRHDPHNDADDVHVQHKQPVVRKIYSL